MPIITLEVLSGTGEHLQPQHAQEHPIADTTLHLVEKPEESTTTEETETDTAPSTRTDLLEYMMRNDGSVICKLCGEILQSRTHWYRHKYKLHVVQPLNPAPLFQCEQCLVYFKSRKGYIGHIASRHSEILADCSPVLSNTQIEASVTGKTTQPEPVPPEGNEKEQPDPELSIPKTTVPNYQTTVVKQSPTNVAETKKPVRRGSKESKQRSGSEEKRSREEKLVADIIDRVRRECEAQGSGGAARRGYTRRYTVMHT